MSKIPRIDSPLAAYGALADALDLIKAAQMYAIRVLDSNDAVLQVLGEARAATDRAASITEYWAQHDKRA